jgi:tRNA threonylcarbamoyladenosine biosynthesis protein TsaB
VLALDTTTREGSVALVEDDRVIVERAGDPARSHAERLPGDLLRILGDAGVSVSAIDVFAVAAGPGLFTGLRIGIATAQGLAIVTGRPIVAVSALEALAQATSRGLLAGSIVGAWMDAHRREVFSALYEVADAPLFAPDRLVEIDRPAVGDPVATLLRWRERFPAVAVLSGDGATAYADLLTENRRVLPSPLLAGAIGLMAGARAATGKIVEATPVQPIYIRRSDAEVDRERRRSPHSGR